MLSQVVSINCGATHLFSIVQYYLSLAVWLPVTVFQIVLYYHCTGNDEWLNVDFLQFWVDNHKQIYSDEIYKIPALSPWHCWGIAVLDGLHAGWFLCQAETHSIRTGEAVHLASLL